VGGIPEADHGIRLRAFLTLDDIELDVIRLFQRFISIQLDSRVMDEYVWPIFMSDESVPLGVMNHLTLPLY